MKRCAVLPSSTKKADASDLTHSLPTNSLFSRLNVPAADHSRIGVASFIFSRLRFSVLRGTGRLFRKGNQTIRARAVAEPSRLQRRRIACGSARHAERTASPKGARSIQKKNPPRMAFASSPPRMKHALLRADRLCRISCGMFRNSSESEARRNGKTASPTGRETLRSGKAVRTQAQCAKTFFQESREGVLPGSVRATRLRPHESNADKREAPPRPT